MPRTLLSLVVLSLAFSGCGATATATAPPPGTAPPTAAAIDVSPSAAVDPMANPSIEGSFAVAEDGRELTLVCWGEGAPTVILETGGTNIEEWRSEGQVRQLAERSRVCTYDRAGTGASDPAPNEKRDADDVIADLSALLESASVDGPYVLLGRSFGGMVAAYYAQEMPDDVLGVVVYDTPAPSAEFTEENAPELAWDYPGNTEHLDVLGGFENRFAAGPPRFDLPLLLITPQNGESSPEDQRYWLKASDDSRQVTPPCECYADQVIEFIAGLE